MVARWVQGDIGEMYAPSLFFPFVPGLWATSSVTETEIFHVALEIGHEGRMQDPRFSRGMSATVAMCDQGDNDNG